MTLNVESLVAQIETARPLDRTRDRPNGLEKRTVSEAYENPSYKIRLNVEPSTLAVLK